MKGLLSCYRKKILRWPLKNPVVPAVVETVVVPPLKLELGF
jgi:hypothetical protein